ncbi:response regulator transcription factor [Noviherbaspirillum aerium]|uniref:response regulator transcription factor n=1 Tax=Noviherbaspirillum aerium TaxID=2588497 RepID=UPI00124CE787|nr:response regulator transcription factor [Noviherbaspirillum aerium]
MSAIATESRRYFLDQKSSVEPQPITSPYSAKTHVLVVEDDDGMRQMITDYLVDNDICVTGLSNGTGIMEALADKAIDLIILDVKLPGQDGMQIARRLREACTIPIIIVTGLKDEADRVMGLELGADDYLTKPFSPRELLARIRALLRRTKAMESISNGLAKVRGYRFGGLEVSVGLRRATFPDGATVDLTNNEFNLLLAFLSAPQCVLTRDDLLSKSRLHNDEVYDRAIDVQIGRLRKKLAAPGSVTSQLIKTERGSGYVLTVPVDIIR